MKSVLIPLAPGFEDLEAVTLSDLSLSNPAGFPQPTMAHAARLVVQLALMPLFRTQNRSPAIPRI